MILCLLSTFTPILLFANPTYSTSNYSRKSPYMNKSYSIGDEKASGMPIIIYSSLADICPVLNISVDDCSCARTPSLCPFSSHISLSNTTDHRPNLPLSKIYASLSLITSVLGIVGNAAVMLVAYIHRHGLPLYKKHITVLALIDFIFSIVQIIDVSRLFWKVEWIYGIAMCKILRSILLLGNLLSIGFITMIALERYFGILYPLKSRARHINIFSALHVTVAIATIIPYFISLKVVEANMRCEERWQGGRNASLVYQWYLAVIYFIIPVCVTTYLYRKVFRHLSNKANTNSVLTIEIQREKRISDNRRIMYILISILVAFVVFTLPNRVLWIYSVTTGYKNITSNTYFVIIFISYLTYPFHICVNPIIYSVIDRKWRKDLINIVLRSKQLPSSAAARNRRDSNDKNSSISPLAKKCRHSELGSEKATSTSRL